MFAESLSASGLKQLESLGVQVHLDCHVKDIQADHVIFQADKDSAPCQRIDAATVVWAAGVKASPLGKALVAALNCTAAVDRAGRVSVGPDCAIVGHPNVFVLGDLASQKGPNDKPLPGLAPVATQQGEYVAEVVTRRLTGKSALDPFKYRDKGMMATIGNSRAVADAKWIKLSGWLAWMAWLFIHIMYLARFENRVLVMWQWFFNYMTRNRAARLITGKAAAETS